MSKHHHEEMVLRTFSTSAEIEESRLIGESLRQFTEDDDPVDNEAIGLTEPESSFETLIRMNVKLLTTFRLFSTNFRLSGRLVNTNTRDLTPIILQVSQMLFVSSCQFRSFIQLWSVNPDYAITIFTGMIPGILCIFKGVRLWFCQVKLRELLMYLAILWEKSRFDANHQKKTMEIAQRTNLIRTWFLGMLAFLLCIYCTRPYMLLLQFELTHKDNETFDYSETIYPTMYPFEIDTLMKYLACVFWEQCVAVLLVFYWASCDSLFAQLVTHTAIQFQVLHYDLKCIGIESATTRIDNEDDLLRKLTSIAKRHHKLSICCDTIETVYNPIIFFTMVTSAINICFCVLNLQKEMEHGNHEEVAKNIVQLITVFIQTMIYCGYADNLTDQSFRIADAAYQCHWIERSSNFKMVLQVIMMRAQRLHQLSGYGFFRLSLKQITTIVNSAMSFFTILKTMT